MYAGRLRAGHHGGCALEAGGVYGYRETTFEQRLVDGNVISAELRTRMAQNADGWMRQEFSAFCMLDQEGKPRRQLQVTINKPKARETLHWNEGYLATKEATLTRPIALSEEQRAAQLARAKAARPPARPALRPEQRETRTESLGTATIAGMEATGSRTVRTIPPGEEGNSLPLVVTTEMWRTKDGVTVRYITDDPRRGRTASELDDVIQGEPDAGLFAPPEGYTVKENVPQERVLVEATTKTP